MPWHLRMIITIFLLLIAIYIYIGFRFSHALVNVFSLSIKTARLITFSILTLISLFPIIILLYYASGNINDIFILKDQLQWQDYVFLFPFWIGLIVIIEIFPYYLLIDILNLIFHPFKLSILNSWLRWTSILKLIISVIFIFYVGIDSYLDTNRVEIKQYSVPIKNLPNDLKDLKITLFADVQVDRYTHDGKLTKVANQLDQTNGDLLLYAGDLVTSGKGFIDDGVRFMCGLKASLSRVSCLGDHDYWSDSEEISTGLEQCGWNFLKNQHYIVNYNGYKVLITGIVYVYSQKISGEQLDELLGNAPPADLKILLVHQPAHMVIEAAKKYHYDLVLAGHTHGGQIVFRPFGFTLTPTMFENPHFSGYENDGGIPVIISNGIGLTLAPLRYNAPAEISKIRLVRK